MLIWLDLEMTGLDPIENTILEIATVVTDNELVEVAVGPVLAIQQTQQALEKMDSWNVHHHTASGLIERVQNSKVTMAQAEQETLDFLREYLEPEESPMCGNSICMDRRFLAQWMPLLEKHFHYRNLDVSTVKILASLWKPELQEGFEKTNAHEALSDIRESIAELRYYRQHLLANMA